MDKVNAIETWLLQTIIESYADDITTSMPITVHCKIGGVMKKIGYIYDPYNYKVSKGIPEKLGTLLLAISYVRHFPEYLSTVFLGKSFVEYIEEYITGGASPDDKIMGLYKKYDDLLVSIEQIM